MTLAELLVIAEASPVFSAILRQLHRPRPSRLTEREIAELYTAIRGGFAQEARRVAELEREAA